MQTESNKKSSGWKWFWGIFISLMLLVGIFVGVSFIFFAKTISSTGDKKFHYEITGRGNEKIAVVDLNYTIISSEPIVRQFKKYREDKTIKAIVLKINTPGGGVAASQEMYEAIRKTRDEGKPVIVSIGSIGASGGYMAACGGTYIVSNAGSVVGSIGVIAQFVTMKELADKLGIKEVTIKSGKLKDAGNPLRDVNPDDLAYFQDIIDDDYQQFLEIVSKERKIEMDTLKLIANGRVFTGRQSLKLKLVDTIGTYEDAINIACKYANIKGEPVIVREKEKYNLLELFVENLSHIGILGFKHEIEDEYLNKPILQYKFEK
ncbi:MAG: signal peptide peptidase SppA [Ignavibacteriae bacterium]|nr:signal peptide peptidase SppA [Ignavibacteriota bacterium]